MVAARGDAPASNPDIMPGVSAAAPAPAAAAPAGPPLRATSLHLGLVPMPADGEVDVHGLSFSFIADRVGALSSGTQLSLGFNLIDQRMNGTQLTIGANVLRGSGRGAQVSVGANYAAGELRGAQLANGANITMGEMRGAQLAAGANWADAGVHGAQLAAGVDIVRGGGRGAQLAGGVSIALGGWRGLQMAGGVNVTDQIAGAQIAPVNVAADTQGLQLGVVNVTAEGAGAQIGVVNFAKKSKGFTLGVVNVAGEHDGEAFGLVNIIGNGIHDVAAYATESMLSNVELKLGSRRVYTSFIFAYQPGDDLGAGQGPAHFERRNRRYGLGLGAGFRHPLDAGRMRFVELAVSALNVESDLTSPTSDAGFSFDFGNDAPLLTSTRVIVGVEITHGLMAIAGLSMNAAIAWGGRNLDIGPNFLSRTTESGTGTSGTTVHQYPGLLLGLEI
jgi:hypothetical protein